MGSRGTISLSTARTLLDFGSRINDPHRAEEQLKGAVAIHNILQHHGVAYLADEVGMGKTYVALGALAMFRHANPKFRVLIISPRENIQKKWRKELLNFSRHNVRLDDGRMRSEDGSPPRTIAVCENITQFLDELKGNSDKDFFLRLTSFSLPMHDKNDSRERIRDELISRLPWLTRSALRSDSNMATFKRHYARALCCAMPKFDLVIIDEAHNLKHGRTVGSDRIMVLAEAFGQLTDNEPLDRALFPGHGRRATRVLFLSATPIEDSYRQLWNQLDVFGMASQFDGLKSDDIREEEKRRLTSQFMVRRVTSIKVNGSERTKNMYRREWRNGGVALHDTPITIVDERQRLVIALMQKKVSELLGDKFNHSYQVGMLASFESFLETTRLKKSEGDPIFDDADQTQNQSEREGVDVHDINLIATDYRQHFGQELPHPKMDALVDALVPSFRTGRKALVFVRRVASVKEIKQKLDAKYDEWLINNLKKRLPASVSAEIDSLFDKYRQEKLTRKKLEGRAVNADDESSVLAIDTGDIDTFFAWYFRGDGPKGYFSGAHLQSRFNRTSGVFSTFFQDNHVMWLLDATSGNVLEKLANRIGKSKEETEHLVCAAASKYLGRKNAAKRAERTYAAQAGSLKLLVDFGGDVISRQAMCVLGRCYQIDSDHVDAAPEGLAGYLEHSTFFSELRKPQWVELRSRIWPGAPRDTLKGGFDEAFVAQDQRAFLLAGASRLGHALIDLYCVVMSERSTLAINARPDEDEHDERHVQKQTSLKFVEAYLQHLDDQRRSANGCDWGAFDELAEISENFELIRDVNAEHFANTSSNSNLLHKQQPVGGMSGSLNKSLVAQFRMPGYPFLLVTTDLLQEGEDLHTFCSSVFHYGIAWNPSSMEQRTGRIDRVRSQSERRLLRLEREPVGEDKLQVFFPHLEDTVEVLQVERVLDRMDTFMRLVHEGASSTSADQRAVNVQKAMIDARKRRPQSDQPLISAFPIQDCYLS